MVRGTLLVALAAGVIGAGLGLVLSVPRGAPATPAPPAPAPASRATAAPAGMCAPPAVALRGSSPGAAHEAAGELAEAEAAYRQAIASDPGDAAALLGLGRVLRARSPLQSEEVLERALQLDSDDPAIWFELAVTQAHMLHYEDATHNAEAVLGLDAPAEVARNAEALIAFMKANPRRPR